jgi:hypothetical protein
MDKGYITMVLNLYFVIMEKIHFFQPANSCLVAAALPYCVLFAPLAFP